MRITFFLLILLVSACQSNTNKLFRLLPSSSTGITFNNSINPTEDLNPFNFTNFYNGGGVGIADFNKDGIPDICFTANQHDPELYQGLGEMKFKKISQTGLQNNGWAMGISIVDANQDGWPDIYLSMAAHPGIEHSANQLYINQKTEMPTFKEEAAKYGLDFKGFTAQTAFFDFDKDGDLDAYLLNTDPDITNPTLLRSTVNDGSFSSSDKLFENTGRRADGSYYFQDISQKAGIVFEGLGLGLALSDFNGDGFTDVYCSNDFQSDDIFYQNNGDGTFSNVLKKSVKHTAMFGMGIDAADFNNDGFSDIFQLDMLPEESERQKMMIPRNDFEKKKLSVSEPYNYHWQYMRNMLQVNLGMPGETPVFSEQGLLQNVATTDWSWSILLADYDLDGRKDAFIANGYRKNVTDLDFMTYHKNQVIFGDEATRKKQQLEILKDVPEIKLKNYAFQNSPKDGFKNVSEVWGLDELSYSNGAAYADLDLDGDLDLVVNNIDEEAFVYENQSVSKSSVSLAFKGIQGNLDGIGAKVKVYSGPTYQMLEHYPTRGYLSSMNTPLLVGLDSLKIIDSLIVLWPNGNRQVLTKIAAGTSLTLDQQQAVFPGIEDYGQNKRLFSAPVDLPYLHRESDYVDFHKTPTLQKMLSRNGPALASADLNNDGLEDIVIGGAFRGSPSIAFLQTTNGSFVAFDTLDKGSMEVGAIAIHDFDSDGQKDILLVPGFSENTAYTSASYQPQIFVQKPSGFELAAQLLPRLNICSETVLVHDFNRDGKQDILLGGGYIPNRFPEFEKNILLIAENGRFKLKDEDWLNNDFGLKSMVKADINGDRKEEILLTGHWGGVISIDASGRKTALNIPNGWWNVILPADIDGDGDLDLILGNEGLNSLYKASEKRPVSLLAKDFNKDGSMDPIWGLYLKDKEVAIHPMGTLTDQIVQYKKRFLNFKEYSEASLEDLFTRGDLKNAMRFKVTELRSGIALNDGQGNFSFQAFPTSAQLAPVQSILYADFTQDGQKDILLLGNFYDNESAIGQSDASYGSLLKNEGKGHFKHIPNSESGLMIGGNVRKAILLPKSKSILVTRNNDQAIWVGFGVK